MSTGAMVEEHVVEVLNEKVAESAASTPPRRVLIIDDELAGLTIGHLKMVVEIDDAFGDINSPIVEELWEIARSIKGFKPLAETPPKDAFAFLNSNAFVNEVLLSQVFLDKATHPLKDLFQPFISRADAVKKLRDEVARAYSAPRYELAFIGDRPANVADVLKYELVIFDLVLENSAAAVDDLINYLKALSKHSPDSLPCLIIMSSRPELKEKRLHFSTESNISAAGLMILPKSEISHSDFGAEGLMLSDTRLNRQKAVAQHMRAFMRAWTDALTKATQDAATTLWNLDASTMQDIHLAAHLDRDPYDEHVSELIAREYQWHVESSPAVRSSIEAMDLCFQEALDGESIKQRFITPQVDQDIARTLLTHFNSTGLASPASFLDMDVEEIVKRFNRLLPFGAVLAPPEITIDTLCYIHITQQCDLNSAIREKEGKYPALQSAQFAAVKAVEIQTHDVPLYKGGVVVARGLKIADKEYDFELQEGQQLALPIRDFIQFAKDRKLTVAGRLRYDIATYFLVATVNHMTRPALIRPTRKTVRTGSLYLLGASNPNGEELPFIDKDRGEIAVVSAVYDKKSKRYAFQDDSSIHISLWLRELLTTHYKEAGVSSDEICQLITVRGAANKEILFRQVTLRVFEQPIKNLKKALAALNPQKTEVSLCLVYAEKEIDADGVEDEVDAAVGGRVAV